MSDSDQAPQDPNPSSFSGGTGEPNPSQPPQATPEVTSGTVDVAAQPGVGAQPPHAGGNGSAPATTDAAKASGARFRWPRASGWLAVAVACALVGIAISVFAAQRVASSDGEAARRDFSRSSSNVTAAVKTGLQRQEDVMTSAGTYLAGNSNGTPAEFHAWGRWARALRNHPDIQTLSLLALVRQPELPTFETRLGETPKTFRLVPPVKSTYHCLAFTAISRSVATLPAQGLDYCASNPGLLTTRDSAKTTFAASPVATGPVLEAEMPVYRGGGVPPRTGLGRRAAFVGWLRAVIDPRVTLQRALAGQPGAAAARLRHATRNAGALFTTGSQPSGAQSVATDLHGGWSLKVFGPSASTGLFANGDSVAVLIGGVLLSLLAGAVLFLLGRGPSRAVAAPAPKRTSPPRGDLYDPLTGLPSRELTLDRADRMLARAGRQSGILVGALFIDIDWFKDVNEKLGEQAGDEVLKIVAERLEQVVRSHDSVGRFGSDEYVVLVESAARSMRLDSLARRVIEALHKPVELEGFGPSFHLTASIGVAFGRYATPDDLLRDAQMALVAAKAAGKDRYTLFNANMRSVIEGRGVLEAELNTAIQDEQFSLLYQPIVDLSSNRPVALEALLRWQHPTKGEVSPNDFIPLAEESGLIVPIGRWVLERACADAAAWNVAGHRVAIAVKVSAYQLGRDGFATDVRRALQMSGLEPALLALEIAETTVMFDAAAAARRMEELKQLGVRIAIDDFGSGYAYRADLQRMPIDFLKVDRSSLAASEDEDYRSWLLEAILVFGRDLSLTVVAKGVESEDQLTALRQMGCSMAQGYFVGQPVLSTAVEALLAAPTAPPAPVFAGMAPAPLAVGVTAAAPPFSPAPSMTSPSAPPAPAPPAPTALAPATPAPTTPAPATAAPPAASAVPAPATAAAQAMASPAPTTPAPAQVPAQPAPTPFAPAGPATAPAASPAPSTPAASPAPSGPFSAPAGPAATPAPPTGPSPSPAPAAPPASPAPSAPAAPSTPPAPAVSPPPAASSPTAPPPSSPQSPAAPAAPASPSEGDDDDA